jgi:hypothetical protein
VTLSNLLNLNPEFSHPKNGYSDLSYRYDARLNIIIIKIAKAFGTVFVLKL